MKIWIFITFLFFSVSVMAQNVEGLKTINAKSKVQFVTPDALDRLMIDLRQFEKAEDHVTDSILLDTYLSISNGYLINNHYKRSYEVYDRYLFRKEDMLTRQRKSAIDKALGSVAQRKGKDDSEKSELVNNVNALQDDINGLKSKRLSFKRYFSFALIILSSIFAIMIVSAGIRMMSVRSKLRQGRDRMKNIHRLSLLGSFEEGLRSGIMSGISELDVQLREMQNSLKQQEQNANPVRQSNQAISKIEKILREISDKLNH